MRAPTAVLVHGILGSRRNLREYAKLLAQKLPAWQFLLVDLRCHGNSAKTAPSPPGTNGVGSAARDILELLGTLRLFPHTLIGHSFGGKVVMSMVQQFGSGALPRPVQVWVLDTLPGTVRTGGPDGHDHPGDLIDTLRSVPLPVADKQQLVAHLTERGFSRGVAQWTATNLERTHPGGGLQWGFDLDGIKEMYADYEATDLWNVVEAPPQGLDLNFIRAERSTFRWAGNEQVRIISEGSRVHLLRKAGHWVHSDNPSGLADIMIPEFQRCHNDRVLASMDFAN